MLLKNYRGVVIREVQVKESDKIITVFTKNFGLVSFFAKGARKAKSNIAGTSLFSYGDFITTSPSQNALGIIKEVETIKTFYNLTKDYNNIFIATYLAEHCYKGLMEGNNDDILFLLINCLNQLDKGVINNRILLSIFELKFMEYNGYIPITTNCTICGNTSSLDYFGNEGVICSNCKNIKNIKINNTILYTIKYILNNEKLVFDFDLEDKYVKILNEVTKHFIINNIEYNLKTINML